MKIKNLMLKNFAKVSEISVNFDKNITYLIGENASGKTTVGLNGVWFVFKGLAQKGDGLIAERFRFIGPHSKSAKAELTIYDEAEGVEIKISRKLLKNKTELKIEASDGRELDQAWLDSIFNAFLIDPVGFSRLSGKEQALAFGADTAKFDLKKKTIELERRDIGRDVTRLQGVVDSAGNPEKIEAVDVAGLMAELEKRSGINTAHKEATINLSDMDKGIKVVKSDIADLEASLIITKERLKKAATKRHDYANEITAMKTADEQEIKDQIESAQGVNQKATEYQQFRENESALDNSKLDYEGKTVLINDAEDERAKYLKSLDLPWPNITITDEGEFRLNDKPFCSPYFSTGEMLMFGSRIGSKLKGEQEDHLKYVYFPSSNVMDDKNRENTFKKLNEDGFQIVAEYISTEKIPEKSCILLKEMKVVESYDESEGNGLK